jgi:hypothetical protein
MAMAWVTKVENSTSGEYTILQNDPTWHPVINGKQYRPDEPIIISPKILAGSTISIPIPSVPSIPPITYVTPTDINTKLNIEYCVVPWQSYGRLRLIGPNQKWVDYEVGRFVSPDKDHLRATFSDGSLVFVQELGNIGGAWWSVSYNFLIRIDDDMGVRWIIESSSRGLERVPAAVAAVSDVLRDVGKAILDFFKKP